MSAHHISKDDLRRIQDELTLARMLHTRSLGSGDAERLMERLIKTLDREGRA